METSKEILVNPKNNKKGKKLQKQSTVLVVDDEEDAVNIFSDYLEIKGISNVERCTNAKDAIDTYEKLRPGVVFLDIMMPELDGFYVLEQIRKIDSNAKIILVTADKSSNAMKKIKEVNPTDVIYKPYDIEQIMRHVNT